MSGSKSVHGAVWLKGGVIWCEITYGGSDDGASAEVSKRGESDLFLVHVFVRADQPVLEKLLVFGI